MPFLLSLVPYYNFLALRFDHNAALTPLWEFTTWAFMRSLDTRHYEWGLLTGLGAAGRGSPKYWSVFLLLAPHGRDRCSPGCSDAVLPAHPAL